MTRKKPITEYHEGAEAARRFDTTMQRVLRVSKEELIKREAEHDKTRRPKNKRSPS